MESKKAIYDIIPCEYFPKTILIKAGTEPCAIFAKLEQEQFVYPLIGKPDIGGRGRGVKKLDHENDVLSYAGASRLDFLVQEFVSLPNEELEWIRNQPTIHLQET